MREIKKNGVRRGREGKEREREKEGERGESTIRYAVGMVDLVAENV